MSGQIGVGMIGYKFMGKSHSRAFRDVARFMEPKLVPVMKALCGRDEAAVKQAAERFGWESWETSVDKLLARDDIQLIDISAPGDVHKEIAVAAAKAGKHILCEKPLANNLADAKEMLGAVESAGVSHMVAFNYRRVPALRFARKLIQEGKLGRIFHWRAVYLQDWIVDPEFPLVWRLRKEAAGSGPLGDLGAHIVDLAQFLVGDITEVVSTTETFIKERPLPAESTGLLSGKAGARRGEVTVEDAVLFLARFQNGALGSFEATRFATGRKNGLRLEINGSGGSLAFDLERLNELEYLEAGDPADTQGWKRILVTQPDHPYMSAWWPPGHIIGWEHTFVHEVYDFLNAIADKTPAAPSFADGVACQRVLEAAEVSAREKRWVSPQEV